MRGEAISRSEADPGRDGFSLAGAVARGFGLLKGCSLAIGFAGYLDSGSRSARSRALGTRRGLLPLDSATTAGSLAASVPLWTRRSTRERWMPPARCREAVEAVGAEVEVALARFNLTVLLALSVTSPWTGNKASSGVRICLHIAGPGQGGAVCGGRLGDTGCRARARSGFHLLPAVQLKPPSPLAGA